MAEVHSGNRQSTSRRAECSGYALVHMEKQNVAERFILDVRHHKLGAAGSLCFLLGDCREAAPQVLQHIQPPDGAGDKQKRQQRAAHKRGDGYDDAHKNACAIPDGMVRFHCRLPSFHKTKRAASGVRSEHLMQPKVRPLFGGHAGCGLILGSLLSANGRKYLYKKVPAGKTPRPIQRNAIYYRHLLQK